MPFGIQIKAHSGTGENIPSPVPPSHSGPPCHTMIKQQPARSANGLRANCLIVFQDGISTEMAAHGNMASILATMSTSPAAERWVHPVAGLWRSLAELRHRTDDLRRHPQV